MTTIWTVVGLVIIGAIFMLVSALRRSNRAADLGAVSDQWISEQRRDSEAWRR